MDKSCAIGRPII